ncbi:hypothetical protein DL96DRAFT_1816573 [Flagelloscypha sp. PMI_526]|nr:hypothetical protein DL96DRAFT_1816573 [Flagelloscypha sp. PMI_526]
MDRDPLPYGNDWSFPHTTFHNRLVAEEHPLILSVPDLRHFTQRLRAGTEAVFRFWIYRLSNELSGIGAAIVHTNILLLAEIAAAVTPPPQRIFPILDIRDDIPNLRIPRSSVMYSVLFDSLYKKTQDLLNNRPNLTIHAPPRLALYFPIGPQAVSEWCQEVGASLPRFFAFLHDILPQREYYPIDEDTDSEDSDLDSLPELIYCPVDCPCNTTPLPHGIVLNACLGSL